METLSVMYEMRALQLYSTRILLEIPGVVSDLYCVQLGLFSSIN